MHAPPPGEEGNKPSKITFEAVKDGGKNTVCIRRICGNFLRKFSFFLNYNNLGSLVEKESCNLASTRTNLGEFGLILEMVCGAVE